MRDQTNRVRNRVIKSMQRQAVLQKSKKEERKKRMKRLLQRCCP